MRKFWPLLMVLCFGVLDAVSTLFVYWQIGTFEYELGLLTNVLYDLGSIEAVIVFKLMLTCIAAIMLYYIARKRAEAGQPVQADVHRRVDRRHLRGRRPT